MPSLTIANRTFEAMESRCQRDPRLGELVVTTVSAIMTECYPHLTQATPELQHRAIIIQDIIITAFALLDAESWPTRQSGQS